ncbi:hypothetical protein [Streptomyces sp. NPDC059761]|uniref:hypothetical protein n=1 Tax=Streptomyces sp. NPDC059761 TaxID=3346937 RepID=UPI0036480E82
MVYLVLVSRGENDGLARLMNVGACGLRDRCAAPDHWHDLNWPTDGASKIVSARTAEFTGSAKAIGVDKVINFDATPASGGRHLQGVTWWCRPPRHRESEGSPIRPVWV